MTSAMLGGQAPVVARLRSTRFAAAAGMFLAALGLIVLVGWFSHTLALVQVLPQLPPVRRNAAVCMTLSGIALLGVALRGPRWLVIACTGLAGVVSGLTLVEYAFHVNIGIDELLGSNYIGGSPGARMTAVAAVCFAASSMALLLARESRSKWSLLVVMVAGSITAAIGLAAIMAYGLGSGNAFGWGHVIQAPLLTAIGLLILGLGLLAVVWQAYPDPAGTPRWLPVSVTIGVATSAIGLWQALLSEGLPPFALLPAVVLGGGCLMALILGLTIHLAQRAHTQAADLRRSEAFLAKVQQLSSTGGYYAWPDTKEVYWSEQIYRIWGIEPGTPPTREVRLSRIHPDDVQAYQEAAARAGREERDFEFEVRLLMPDGSVKYLHSMQQATRDAEGRLLYVGAVQDVTARRLSELALSRARSELARVSRITTLGALTASIAHEVNQPLSGIVTNASACLRMLAADPPDLESARETARRTIRDGYRAAEIITRLRSLYGRKVTRPELMDLNEATREVIALSQVDLLEHRVVVQTEFAPGLPLLWGDRIQLQQVMLNLLRNAMEAMPAVDDRPKDLLVKTETESGGRVRLSVRDSGVGFKPETADTLFDPFYTTKDEGMGIGLSISRSIVESHGGRLWATCNDGPGATFTFSLPAAEPDRQADTKVV